VNPDNWQPFIPPNTGEREHFGFSGVVAGAAIVFFAYIGFDSVTTAAQEAKNPQRDMPIAIIGSLIACTVLYIVVSAIATGIVPYSELDVPAPIATVADRTGLGFFAAFIKIGAIAGLTSVILVQLLGQSRIFYSMSRDGLLPPFIRRVHPRFRTPYITSIVTGLGVAIPAAILPVRDAAKLVSIGTLFAFVIVCCGVLVLRIREPNLRRPFKTPFVWFVAPAGALSAAYLMAYLDMQTWIRLLIWLAIGLAIYFLYSRSHSVLARNQSG
jgi:basic amino acid/polyamine antiporter, APA family